MSTNQKTLDFIIDQISSAGEVSDKKMFGEYGIYCNKKIVALVCDDQLFIKPTKSGRAFIGEVVEAPPYSGAKPSFLIGSEKWDDPDWLSQLIKTTAIELPTPKPKLSEKSKLTPTTPSKP